MHFPAALVAAAFAAALAAAALAALAAAAIAAFAATALAAVTCSQHVKSPVVVDFQDQDYCHISIAIQITHDAGLVPI